MSSLRTACVIALLGARVAFGQPAEREFVSKSCHVAFSYPAGWSVTPDTSDREIPCGFTLKPLDWQRRLVADDSVDLFTISLQSFPDEVFRRAAKSGFERRAGGWVVLGRMDAASPAVPVAGAGWRGIRGTAQAGCYREGGGYFGLCETPMAAVGTSSRAVVITGGPRSEDVFDRVLGTLRLSP